MAAIKQSLREEMITLCNNPQLLENQKKQRNQPAGSSSALNSQLGDQEENSSPTEAPLRPSQQVPTKAWRTKAALKQVRQTMKEENPLDQEGEGDPIEDQRQFLSNDDDPAPGEQINRFFSMDDYQQLFCKCISALDLKGCPPPDMTQSPDDDPKNVIKGCGEFFSFSALLS